MHWLWASTDNQHPLLSSVFFLFLKDFQTLVTWAEDQYWPEDTHSHPLNLIQRGLNQVPPNHLKWKGSPLRLLAYSATYWPKERTERLLALSYCSLFCYMAGVLTCFSLCTLPVQAILIRISGYSHTKDNTSRTEYSFQDAPKPWSWQLDEANSSAEPSWGEHSM